MPARTQGLDMRRNPVICRHCGCPPPTAKEEREWLRFLVRGYFRRCAVEQTLSTGQVASETISWA